VTSGESGRVLRAGVIGLGSMGQHHARVWASLSGVELVAVADPRQDVLQRALSATAAQGHTNAMDMLRDERLDVVSVAAPTSLHCQLTVAALRAGAHVLVEKPIAADREEAHVMMDAAAESERLLTVGHVERFNPAIVELRRRLAAGELGRVFEIRAERLGPFPDRIRDVGVVVDLAPHDLDVMRFLLGSNPVRVYAETEQRIHTDHEDLFAGVMKFEDGTVGLLDINWLTPTKQRRLTVTGERGMFVADYLAQELTFYANSSDGSVSAGPAEACPIEHREPLLVELEAFADAIRAGGPPPVDPREALVALLLARAMVEAANSGMALSGESLAAVLT
jgi:UDP-N-acetylglucosamine 3-dehydrogenase